jgi:hypothetical protein
MVTTVNKYYGNAILYELNEAKTKFRLAMQDLYVEASLRGSHNAPPVDVSELPTNYKLRLRNVI